MPSVNDDGVLLLRLSMAKYAYQEALSLYDSLPLFRRLVTRRPSDPVPQASLDALAQAFRLVVAQSDHPFGEEDDSLLCERHLDGLVLCCTLLFDCRRGLPRVTLSLQDGSRILVHAQTLDGEKTVTRAALCDWVLPHQKDADAFADKIVAFCKRVNDTVADIRSDTTRSSRLASRTPPVTKAVGDKAYATKDENNE